MVNLFWEEFGILFAAALLGGAAIMPYSLRLLEGSGKPLPMSKSKLLLLSLLQTIVIFAIVTGVGLLLAHTIGLGAPYLEALLTGTPLPSMTGLIVGIIFGTIAGAILLIADIGFLPYWPQALRETSLKTTMSENFLASFYGGIDEEILMRLFGLSLLAWLFSFVVHDMIVVLWIANIVMTIIFGIGHLPALKGLLGTISRAMFFRSLVLNAPVGLLCGWLFWTYGIESAILAHFFADIVYHVYGSVVLQRKLKI